MANTNEQPSSGSTLLRSEAIRQRMKCNGSVAAIIEDTFVTVEQLLAAVESDDPVTEVDGIGPKAAEAIEDWDENREEREANARSTTVTRTGPKSISISSHGSWADALGMEESDE